MKKRGVGVGCMWYGIANAGSAGAVVELQDDGTIDLFVGSCDLGQGSDTMVAQIAAEELGLEVGDVRVWSADTGMTPDAGGTTGSKQTYISGNAALIATEKVKQVLVQEAASLLSVPLEDIALRERMAVSVSQPNLKKSFRELISSCRRQGKDLTGHGTFTTIGTSNADPETGQGEVYAAYSFATQIAEVEVDLETGEVDVLRLAAAHDVGRAINPLCIEGQIEGGSAMGLGFALVEEVLIEDGVVITDSLADYIIPTSLDVPKISSVIVEEPEETGPFGAKGIGEPALIPTAAAIVNAIYDAVGVRVMELPVTPERLWRAIHNLSEKQPIS